MAWNCTGTKLASGSVDQTARIWFIETHGHVSFAGNLFVMLFLFGGLCPRFFMGNEKSKFIHSGF